MIAAKKAGKRMSSAGRRARKSVKKMKKSLAKSVSPCAKGVDEQIRREKVAMSGFPFIDVRTNSGKSRVVSGPSQMAAMGSNKRFKPGD